MIDAVSHRCQHAAELLGRYHHEAVYVRDIGMGGAADSDIAAYAQRYRLALVTRDFDFADIRNYPPTQYAGREAGEKIVDQTMNSARWRIWKCAVPGAGCKWSLVPRRVC
jgi:Domain of unknown function (DUF5615)